MSLLRRIEQEEEIKSIKSRKYNINLSDADVERLAVTALNYGVTASDLLENFIGDLVGGTYSNGSDERMYATKWADRSLGIFMEEQEKNLTTFCIGSQGAYGYTYEDLVEIMERIESAREDISRGEKEISNPQGWENLVRWNSEKQEYVQSYNTVEEYIEMEKDCLQSYKIELELAEQELQEFKDEFDSYMKGREYSWDCEVENCQKWYTENIANFLNSPEEKDVLQSTSHNIGGGR